MIQKGEKMSSKEGFRQLTKKYLDDADVSLTTKQSYERILQQFVEYANTLSDLPTRSDIMAYRDHLFKRKLEETTIKYHLVVVRNFYRWYHTNGHGANPSEGIKSPKIEKKFKRAHLSESESRQLLKLAQINSDKNIIKYRDYVMVLLMLTTGMRTVEVERADVSDLNVIDDGEILYVHGKGKTSKSSFVRLSPLVNKAIETYIMKRSDQYEPLFIDHKPKYLGQRMKTRNIRRIIKDLLRDIGFDDDKHTAHSLRHTTATLARQYGANKDDTQKIMRHSDPATTEIYMHAEIKSQHVYEHVIAQKLLNQEEDEDKKN
ncbi:tyrosine-type recombinase/integrase [Acholeplasma laidlawii]|nr:tyrosine-type recombinase/integrase [Acholeplasma laidlawii]NWH10226.1 tyrosine-type recombinase/integrase [Acholeplasma laidlawii]